MKNINTDEIIKIIEEQGITVIPVNDGNFKAIKLSGNLENFIAAAKAFNENVTFMDSFSFGEDDFLNELKSAPLGEYNEPPGADGIDLRQFLPELKEYEIHIKETSLLIFRLFYKNQAFAYWHQADWFEVFADKFAMAKDIFEERENLIKEQGEQQKDAARENTEQRVGELRGLLDKLSADDENFLSLKTQRSQLEYVLKLFPELDDLPPQFLRNEISSLNARIQAVELVK